MSDPRLNFYRMDFNSMEPAIEAGTDILGDTAHYLKNNPARWDIVAFSMGGKSSHFVKRILGLPGETIQFNHKGFMIQGSLVPLPLKLHGRFGSFSTHRDHKFGVQPFRVPADAVFVIGDNPHEYVTDSRELGPIPIKNLLAKILASVVISPIS